MTDEEKNQEGLEKGIDKAVNIANEFFSAQHWILLHRVPYCKKRVFRIHVAKSKTESVAIIRIVTEVEGEMVEGLKKVIPLNWKTPLEVNDSLDALSAAIEMLLAKIMRKGMNHWLNQVTLNLDAI